MLNQNADCKLTVGLKRNDFIDVVLNSVYWKFNTVWTPRAQRILADISPKLVTFIRAIPPVIEANVTGNTGIAALSFLTRI